MSTTTAKITVRKGDMVNLPKGPVSGTSGTPKLAAGEFAYATDERRLFIGNDIEETKILGDGSTVQFNFGVDLDNIDPRAYDLYECDLDGSNPVALTKGADYDYKDYVVTFTTAPASTKRVVLYYLTELLTFEPDKNFDAPIRDTLVAGATSLPFAAITLDSDHNNYFEIEYTITTSAGDFRKGIVSIGLEPNTNAFTISDNYDTTTTALDHSFNGVHTHPTFILNYTNTYTSDVTFSYIIRDWKS